MMKYLKAIYAAVFAGLGSTATAYAASGGHIGVVAGIGIATSVLMAGGATWGVANQTSTPTPPPAEPTA